MSVVMRVPTTAASQALAIISTVVATPAATIPSTYSPSVWTSP